MSGRDGSRGRAVRRLVGVCAGVTLAGFLSHARAEELPSARLVYEVQPSAGVCPDEGTLSNLVAGRLGYVPFRGDARQTVRVVIDRTGDRLRARMELLDQAQKVRGKRELTGRAEDCDGLVAAVAAAIGLALDPLRIAPVASSASVSAPSVPSSASSVPSAAPPIAPSASVSPPASSSAPPVAPPPASAAPAPAPPPASEPLEIRGALLGIGSQGASPAPAFGVGAYLGARRRWASLGVEGRADFPVSEARGAYTARSSLLLASLLPCGHRSVFLGCAVFAAGSLQAEGGGVAFPTKDRATYAAIGARLGVEVPVTGVVFVTGYASVLATITRLELAVAGREIWQTAPITLALGAGLGASF